MGRGPCRRSEGVAVERTYVIQTLRWADSDPLGNLLEHLPFSIRHVHEDWGLGHGQMRVGGTVQVDVDPTIDLAGFRLQLGVGGAHDLEVPFGLDLPENPAALALVAALIADKRLTADDAKALLGTTFDPNTTYDSLHSVIDGHKPAIDIGPVPLRLAFPKNWLEAGRLTTDAKGNTKVEPAPDAPPVEIVLGTAELGASIGPHPHLSAKKSTWLDHLSLPPVVVAGTGLALELDDLKIHDGGTPPPSALADLHPRFKDGWCGVTVDTVTVWGLDTLFPFLDGGSNGGGSLTLHDWAIDGEGMAGRLEIDLPAGSGFVTAEKATLVFTGGWAPTTLSVTGKLHPAALLGGSAAEVSFTADLTIDPHAAPADRWAVGFAFGGAGTHLARIDSPTGLAAAATAAAAAAVAGARAAGTAPAAAEGARNLALLLGLAAALDAAKLVTWKQLTVVSATAELRSGSRGPQLEIGLELDVGLQLRKLPEIDHPVALTVSSKASVTVTFGDPVSLTTAWTLDEGLSVALPAAIDLGGVVTITEIGLRRPEKGHLSLELGVAPSGTGDAAVGGLPNVVALDYDEQTRKVSVHVERKNQPVVLLVPDVLYAEGTLERGGAFSLGGSPDWGPPLRGQLRAFLVGNGTAGTLAEQMQKKSYLFDLEVGLLSATSKKDGLQALVLTLDADFHPGLPLGTSGTSLYGIGLTYGQNAKPDTPDGPDPYGRWFLDRPAYTTAAGKWTPKAGHWGFGAGVSLGSQPDGGRSWNAAAALILLLPGPTVLLTGKGNLFAPPPTLPKPGATGSGDISAPFAAILALDFAAKRFTADLRAQLDVKANGKDLVKAHVPAEIDVELEHPSDFHVYLGQSAPPEKRISATALDLLDVSGYLMIGGNGLDLTPSVDGSRPLSLPGLAAAYGAAAGIDWSFSHPPFALKLWATLGYDLGASFALPPLLVGFVYAEGGLHATAFGVGAELDAVFRFAATAPDPFALDGVASVHLALPWPLPDLDARAKLTFGTPKQGLGRLPEPPDVIGDAVAYDPLTGKRTPLAPHGARAADIPVVQVDTGLLLPFEAAMGNENAKLGSTTLDGVDTADPVWQVLTDDGRGETLGYRHVLTELSLTAHGGGAVEALAAWPSGTAGGNAVYLDAAGTAGNAGGHPATVPRTAGNQVARTHVQLLDVAGDEVLRRVGTGADLVERRLSAWSPCTLPDRATKATQDEKGRTRTAVAPGGPPSIGVHPPERPPPVAPPPGLRPRAADAVLGPTPVPLREETAIDGATTWVSVEAPPAASEYLRRQLGAHVTAAEIVGSPIAVRSQSLSAGERVLALPTLELLTATHAQVLENAVDLAARADLAGWLVLDLPAGERTTLDVVLDADTTIVVEATPRGSDTPERVLVPSSGSGGVAENTASGSWRYASWGSPAHADYSRIRLFALRAPASQSSAPTALLTRVHTTAPPPVDADHASAARDAAARFASKRLDQVDGWIQGKPAGLLEPNTLYTLTAKVESTRAKRHAGATTELDLDVHTSPRSKSFTFRTAASPPARLRPRRSGGGDLDSAWQVATDPVDGAPAHYLDDPILLRFRDPRVLGTYAAHGRGLRLRLVDEHGNTLKQQLDALAAAAAEELDAEAAAQAAWLGSQSCLLPGGRDPKELWRELTQRITAGLAPGLRYEAELHATPTSRRNGPFKPEEVVHAWRFRTSRWASLDDHARDHAAREEVVPVPDSSKAASALRKAAKAAKGHPDGHELDRLLFDVLKLSPRPAPEQPELDALWLWQPGADAIPVGFLLDGPEPLLRPGVDLSLRIGRRKAAAAVVTGSSRTRILVVPTGSWPPSREAQVHVELSTHAVKGRCSLTLHPKPKVFRPQP